MPKRILTYLDNMDKLRDETDLLIDEMLKKLDINKILTDNQYLKIKTLQFIKNNNNLFKSARVEGNKLAKSLK